MSRYLGHLEVKVGQFEVKSRSVWFRCLVSRSLEIVVRIFGHVVSLTTALNIVTLNKLQLILWYSCKRYSGQIFIIPLINIEPITLMLLLETFQLQFYVNGALPTSTDKKSGKKLIFYI